MIASSSPRSAWTSLPPHVSAKQARAYAKALAHHDPQGLQTVIASAREWWDGVFAGRHDGR